MILAAGFGTRLRPLTEKVPKPLLEVAGRPMIAYALELVAGAGIHEVVINLHYLGDQIRALLGNGERYGVKIFYSVEPQLLDTGGGIAAAREYLCGQPFVVVNADVYLEGDLRSLIDFHHRSSALTTLWVRPDPTGRRKDDVRVDADGRVRGILGHTPAPDLARRCQRYFYASVMVCSPEIFEFLPSGIYSLTRDVLPHLLAENKPVFAKEHTGYWRVLDTHEDFEIGCREIAARRAGLPPS
ncbi:MAG: NDP-sugar synthase [Candidatus Binatia bacterium]|nr:NDP-sugar synthase [Candidatus Binatia bacterium]